MTFYLSKLEGTKPISFSQAAGRKELLFVIEAQLTINGDTVLQTRDSVRITDVPQLELVSDVSAISLLIIYLNGNGHHPLGWRFFSIADNSQTAFPFLQSELK